MASVSKRTGHRFCSFLRCGSKDTHHRVTCSLCFKVWHRAKDIKTAGKCPVKHAAVRPLDRARAQWRCCRRIGWMTAHQIAKAWQLSENDVRSLEKGCSHYDMPKLPVNFWKRCSEWQRDLCAENIHPHPGPSSSCLLLALGALLVGCRFRFSPLLSALGSRPIPGQSTHQTQVTFWRQVSVWKRNLCAENIHPHPGPSSVSRARVMSLNVACKSKAWHVIPELLTDDWDIICLQELHMKEAEVHSLEKSVRSKGYTLHYPKNAETEINVAIVIRQGIKARMREAAVDASGQLISMDLDHTILTCVHRRALDSFDFATVFAHHVVRLPQGRRFVAVGDWNLTPDEAIDQGLLDRHTSIECVRNADGTPLPTRWGGTRCIDWILTNDPHASSTHELSQEKWSDHRGLNFCLQRVSHAKVFQATPTKGLGRPSFVSVEQWTRAVKQCWPGMGLQRPDVGSLWDRFNGVLENALNDALALCRADSPKHLGKRRKGSAFRVHARCSGRVRAKQDASFKERKLRKHLGRLRLFLQSPTAANGRVLAQKVYDRNLPDVPLTGNVERDAEILENVLDDMEKSAKKERIHAWNERVQCGGRAAFKWVRQTDTSLHHRIYPHSDRNGMCARDIGEALSMIKSFWVTIWHRPLPDVGNAMHWWTTQVPLRVRNNQMVWQGFDAKTLQTLANKNQVGADLELQDVTDGVRMNCVACRLRFVKTLPKSLTASCEGRVPDRLREIRQVMIPKDVTPRQDNLMPYRLMH